MNRAKAEAYLQQAFDRAAEVSAQVVDAQTGAGDWAAIQASLTSLRANLTSGKAALAEEGEG